MYLTHLMKNQQPIFVMVLPFEQKHLAGQAGFRWNTAQPGAWATDDFGTALAAVKANANAIVVDKPTLDLFYKAGKLLPTTYDRFCDRAAQYVPDRKMKAGIEAATMSDEKIAAIHQALQNLAAVCDGSLRDDMAGFNRNDVEYGHSLAGKSQLTRSDAGYGSLLLYKYRGQIGEELFSAIFPDVYARENQAAADKVAKKEQKEADRAAKKAEKEAPKLHKKGLACNWSGCQLCTKLPGQKQPVIELPASTLEQLPVPVVISEDVPAAIMLPASSQQPLGHYDADKKELTITKPNQIVAVTIADGADDPEKAEIIRLATSLIECYPQDFDTTVELLRALRQIDAPKEAKNDFLKAAWSGAGYQTK